MTLTRRAALGLLALGPAAPLAAQGTGLISGGVPITVERFGAGRRSAVVLLHGSDGPGERYRVAARQVAAGGHQVFLVHYLDRTGDRRAGFMGISRNLPAWTEAARDAVAWAAAQPGVDPRRVGILGISLGGGVGLLAAAGNPRVRAFVDYFGFVPGSLSGAGRLPPTLILHGEADRIVPVSNARVLDGLLAQAGVPRETVIYPGEGHGFSGATAADAAARITRFFGRYLG